MTFLIAILYQSFVPVENSHIVNSEVGMVCIRFHGKTKRHLILNFLPCYSGHENFLGASVRLVGEPHLDL